MTDDDKALVERLRWSDGWFFENPWDHVVYASDDPLEAADRIEAQAAEIERLREMMKIHPMETAPRNGELVILFPKLDDPILVGVFDKYIWHCADQYQEERGEFGFAGCIEVDANLRGWMPLPSATLGKTE